MSLLMRVAANEPELSAFTSWAMEARAKALIEAAAREGREADEALAAFDSDAFGFCADCDQPIDRELLASTPWAQQCADCAPVRILHLPTREERVAARAA
jgi:RNA polymerase-binding transcription factor DksA